MYEELVKALRYCILTNPCELCPYYSADGPTEKCMTMNAAAADAIEELQRQIDAWVEPERKALIKSNKAITAERDAAMKRLCEWCGVGCSMENRRAELCEIAAVGLEFLVEDSTSPDWATCQPEPPKEET